MIESNNVILIAGMHRSGTSLSTNLLRESGLFIGDNLMDGGFDNKNGHFEDYDFVNLHEKDLKEKGYDSTGLKGIHDYNLTFSEAQIPLIKKLIKDREKHKIWGWKDPRSTLYLVEWKKIIPDLKVIAIYRDYDEVVNSLDRRYWYKIKNKVNYDKLRRFMHLLIYPVYSQYLKYNHYNAWSVYNESILKFKELYPQDIVIYNLTDFINNYNTNIDNINEKFDIKLNHFNTNKIFESDTIKHKTNNGIKFFSNKRLKNIIEKLNHSADK
ncbi:sulfotransferase [uncultured Formosa sp.]|uniref:sulfotransferase n=1 Tax=uncultured Formosa sp. TaxID=255435 RepID=UPI00261A0CD1|nr:sulfotransferase [uncultured Formosa sp.]